MDTLGTSTWMLAYLFKMHIGQPTELAEVIAKSLESTN